MCLLLLLFTVWALWEGETTDAAIIEVNPWPTLSDAFRSAATKAAVTAANSVTIVAAKTVSGAT